MIAAVPAQTIPLQEGEESQETAPETQNRLPGFSQMSKRVAAVSTFAVLALAGIGWAWKTNADRSWARASVARVQQLTAEGKYPEGYDLALRVLHHLPAEPTVMRLMSELSDEISVSTTPAGAAVYLRRLGSSQPQRLGVTPIQHFSVARDEFIVSIHKAGYADFWRR